MKAALIGYGKMGHEIEQVLARGGDETVLIIDKEHEHLLTPENLRKADVAIEFSTPETAFSNVMKCLEAGVPVICGTTAWLNRLPEVADYCKKHDGAFFYASNFSIGMNIFFEINRRLAKIMNRYPEYEVSLEEAHHSQKKDVPSGTAVTLAESILFETARKKTWVNYPTTDPQQLAIASVRRSNIPGIHTVTWESEIDYIKIEHSAKSRSGFAVGAVAAAHFIIGKKGVFTMKDLLK